jgi:hypothetical protein
MRSDPAKLGLSIQRSGGWASQACHEMDAPIVETASRTVMVAISGGDEVASGDAEKTEGTMMARLKTDTVSVSASSLVAAWRGSRT